MEGSKKIPPEVRVARISSDGEVLLTFTHSMIFPEETKDILNSRSVK